MKVQMKKRGLSVELLVNSHIPMELTHKVAEMLQTFFRRDSGMMLLGELAEVCPVFSKESSGYRLEQSSLEWPHVSVGGADVNFHAYVERNILAGDESVTVRGIIEMERELPFNGQTVLSILPKRTSVTRRQLA